MGTIVGKPVSAGYAIGQICIYKVETLECDCISVAQDCICRELDRLDKALKGTEAQVKKLLARSVDGSDDSYAIFEGYLEIITDEELRKDMESYIKDNLVSFDTAVYEISKQYIQDMLELDDPYLRARAEDFKQIFRMIKTASSGADDCSLALQQRKEPFILAAKEVGPADMESIDTSLLQGILVETGSKTSHAAILSRGLGIPMVSGIKDIYDVLAEGELCVVDGGCGKVICAPDEKTVAAYTERMDQAKEEKEACLAYLDKEALTKDGTHITLYANIGSEDDVPGVLENKADGIGLFRTEFLFMKNGGAVLPTEEEQFRSYKLVLEKMEGRPVIFRTLDAGGDKNISALAIAKEENPFLGLRAVRYCLRNPEVFKTQLRALLRAAVYGNARIMLPMIISKEEIRQAKDMIADGIAQCKKDGVPVAEQVPLGIMIETPAAAVMAAELAKEAAFFSIGTNDLTQYTLAVDRGNEAIADLYSESHPAVLHLIAHVIRCGRQAGIPVDVCGEMAGNTDFTEQLLACGLREFSMSPIHILRIKRRLAQLTVRPDNVE